MARPSCAKPPGACAGITATKGRLALLGAPGPSTANPTASAKVSAAGGAARRIVLCIDNEMISNISMRNVASYDAAGVSIDTNKKINFFFGYNGSGKSTIARYLHDLTLPIAEQSPDFADCSQTGYNPSTDAILVYNEDFRRDNFITKDEQHGIFSLNKTNADIDKLIKEANDRVTDLQRRLTGAKNRELDLKTKQDRKIKDLDDSVFSKRAQFSSCRNATIPYGGSKKSFLAHIRTFLTHTEPLKQLPDLLQEYNRVYSNELRNIPYCIDTDAFNTLIEQETAISALLDEVIVGNKDVDIAALIDSLQMSSWVEQGLPFLELSGEVCPFCQRPFEDKETLKHKFDQFFDTSYKTKINDLRDKASLYYRGLNTQISCLNEIVKLYNPQNKVSSLISDLQSLKDAFVQVINDKKSKPNERKSITSLARYQERLIEIKSLVTANNTDFANLSNLQNQWLRDAEIFIAEESRTAIEKYDRWKAKSDEVLSKNAFAQTSLQDQITHQLGLIDAYRKHTVNTADAVNNIKKILKNVGFDGFEIQEKIIPGSTTPTYCLKRSGSTATNVYKSLSEGEKTFISFLYFYQLCLGTDDLAHSSKKKIIVIDDPVSSLDSKVMFVITTLIHQLARNKGDANKTDRQTFANINIEQILIFTHNYYFYKEVSFNRRPINKDWCHHIIEKQGTASRIAYSGYDCIIKNDYSMMWDLLKKAKATLGTDKSQNVILANTMRRLIDTYLDFVGMKKSGTTITWSALDTFTEGSPEYIVESAFISFINDESHGVAALDDMYYDSIVKQEPAVIFTAFKALFKDIGASHYEYMMEESF